ncbi:MAG: hypothetical protein RSA00_07650, partial [Hydrogenoanaerobacterium sp.]
ATYAGAVAMTALIVQLTKGFADKIVKLPTQLYSYIIALLVLLAAYFFTGQLTLSNAVLLLFNAVIVSAASNGAYEGVTQVLGAAAWHRN